LSAKTNSRAPNARNIVEQFARIPVERALTAHLTGRQWAVLAAIAAYADKKTGEAFPSLDKIALKTGIGRADLPRIIAALVRAELIEVIRGGARTRGRPSNLYRILGLTVSAGTDSAGTDSRATDGTEALPTVSAGANLSNKDIKPVPNLSPAPATRGTRWPADQVVSEEWRQEGAAIRAEAGLPPVDVSLEADKFVDHWISENRPTGVKRDWRRAWRNWIRGARPAIVVPFPRSGPGSPRGPAVGGRPSVLAAAVDAYHDILDRDRQRAGGAL
jgi:hypothetical protein